jgi:hypothetical protein
MSHPELSTYGMAKLKEQIRNQQGNIHLRCNPLWRYNYRSPSGSVAACQERARLLQLLHLLHELHAEK